MIDAYLSWTLDNVPINIYGKCEEVTAQMRKAFPELTRVRGHYVCLIWGKREHWWLVAPSGTVVDPTAAQFPSRGVGSYLPWKEGSPEPTGKCPNCGGYAYGGGTCCSDKCHDEYVNYLME